MNNEFPASAPQEGNHDLSGPTQKFPDDQTLAAGSGTKSGWRPPSAEELQALLPQYEITEMLGRGGMGAVYRGRQISLDRPVAIKILSSALDERDQGYKERFKNEARAMAKLSHPGIIAVFDFGETNDGLLYIVMEFIEGTDVAKMIAGQGRLHTEQAVAITAHVCDALIYAHDRGIIHRDIKPANVMVGRDGVMKVADFGLAKIHSGESQTLGLTMSGMAMGTVHFMAPEALEYGTTVDRRADIYAVGVMLYQMLTGKVPHGMFEMPSMQVSGLDPRYDRIIAKAMREDREMRYQEVIELRRDLDAILTQPIEKIESDDTQPVATLKPKARLQGQARNEPREADTKVRPPVSPTRPVSVIAVAVLALCGGAYWLYNNQRGTGESLPREGVDTSSQGNMEASALIAVIPPEPAAAPVIPTLQVLENAKAAEVRDFGGIQMVWCPPGKFLMGSPEGEAGRSDDETPHQVTLTKGFWMAKTETTQGQWQRLMGENPSAFIGEDLPVERVSWDDAQRWLVKMNQKSPLPEGWKWALPTEAQWEYACRAGTETVYAGDLEEMACYTENSSSKTNPVGIKKGNAWGLYDMHGNVYEWTADWYGEYESESVIDPTGATSVGSRVNRGGAWINKALRCRSAHRGSSMAGLQTDYLGFRSALVSSD